MMELGVFHGFPDGTFRPDETMTRAQAATVITYLLGKSNEAKDNISATGTKFPDVPAGHWASPYINICVDEGIYAGFPMVPLDLRNRLPSASWQYCSSKY